MRPPRADIAGRSPPHRAPCLHRIESADDSAQDRHGRRRDRRDDGRRARSALVPARRGRRCVRRDAAPLRPDGRAWYACKQGILNGFPTSRPTRARATGSSRTRRSGAAPCRSPHFPAREPPDGDPGQRLADDPLGDERRDVGRGDRRSGSPRRRPSPRCCRREASSRQAQSRSALVIPPGSGVPVPGANAGIEHVDVDGQERRRVADDRDRLLDDRADPAIADVVHEEARDPVLRLPGELLLARPVAAQADLHVAGRRRRGRRARAGTSASRARPRRRRPPRPCPCACRNGRGRPGRGPRPPPSRPARRSSGRRRGRSGSRLPRRPGRPSARSRHGCRPDPTGRPARRRSRPPGASAIASTLASRCGPGGQLAARIARGPKRAPGPVGGEVVHRRADDRDVDPLELGRVLRVRERRVRQQPCVVGLVGEAQLPPALERIDHAADPTLPLRWPACDRLSRDRAQTAARVGGLGFVVLWLLSEPAAGGDPVLAPVRDPRRDGARVRRSRHPRAPSRGRRERRPRDGSRAPTMPTSAGSRRSTRTASRCSSRLPPRRGAARACRSSSCSSSASACSPTPTASIVRPAGRRCRRRSGRGPSGGSRRRPPGSQAGP